ncbi:MAG: lamin tail domain-containing protein, partial [Deltaproteobacteria bacterium]|nr:lamin tail domain-containing protein [Deltaproteobacteria bacterium]
MFRRASWVALFVFILSLSGSAAAANFIVNSPIDAPDIMPGDGVCMDPTGLCPLRAAVDEANAFVGPDNIFFNLPPGPVIIFPFQEYNLTESVTIDGYTQVGAMPNTNPAPLVLTTMLVVEIDGSAIMPGRAVFVINTNNVVIRGLNIHSGPIYEIAVCLDVTNCTNNRIEGNFLGTNPSGTIPLPSGWASSGSPAGAGVYLTNGASFNFVGSNGDGIDEEFERNLISGEMQPGSYMNGVGVLQRATDVPLIGNVISGNLIGSDPSGMFPVSNIRGVVLIDGVGLSQVTDNIISGNTEDGIYMRMVSGAGSNDGNVFQRNYIGLSPISNAILPNGGNGINCYNGCANNIIGGNDWADGNVISGNSSFGLRLAGSGVFDSFGNIVTRNIIGLDFGGSSAIPNGMAGVVVWTTGAQNDIGQAGAGNIISGNNQQGVYIFNSTDTQVIDNWIGRNILGNPVPNLQTGVQQISGSGSLVAGNHILGNSRGIDFDGPSGSNTISGNTIEANGARGIDLQEIDDTNSVELNDISGHSVWGIYLTGSSPLIDTNNINGGKYGIQLQPDYAGTFGPGGAGDDLVSRPLINNNTIDSYNNAGISSLDSEALNGPTLHIDNTIAALPARLAVSQYFRGAVEILDTGNNPIVSGAYQVDIASNVGDLYSGSLADGGLWGPTGFLASDCRTWFDLQAYRVDDTGTLLQGNPFTLTITGPTGGIDQYTFDAVDNDGSNLGGQPLGLLTDGLFRYQIAEVVTDLDADNDGVPDTADCAPNDSGYQGSLGTPCDADSDGYCDAAISGQVQSSACPNECGNPLCDPSDCADGNAQVNPGAVEGPLGAANCSDTLDNDCDTDTDLDDSDCQCGSDAECDNGDACDGIETCVAGQCQNGTPVVCNDDNPCTDDSCLPASGLCDFVNDDTNICNDGLYCTASDYCSAGTCSGDARDCSYLDDDCNDGTCDEGNAECVAQPANEGGACDDVDDCTTGDHCETGSCLGDPLDNDHDGYVPISCGGLDCDDNNEDVNPDASEGAWPDATCFDSLDNDCDTDTDLDDSACTPQEVCGDGFIVGSEECDDDNTEDNDGCSAACLIEAGWDCLAGEPSQCGSLAVAGEVVITEIMQNPSCVDDELSEWLEIYNASGRDLELTGWQLSDLDGDLVVLPSLSLPAGAYAVFCVNADQASNGNVPCDAAYAWSDFTLANGSDEAIISDLAGTLVDQVDYDGGSTFPDPTGASMSLEPGSSATDNDLGSNWCEAYLTIVDSPCGELGTPGVENPSCCADLDQDGYQDINCGGLDCDDSNENVNPGQEEISCDGLDNDCDPQTIDDPDPIDVDEDGYTLNCGGDCDDNDENVNPAAIEIECDQVDNDCDPLTADDPDPTDVDEDSYTLGCGQDCDDSDDEVHPDASEGPAGDATCSDTKDNDCDSDTDTADADCTSTAECGNGTIEVGEDCDDDNSVDGDGCSASCEIEEGYACLSDSEPSICGSTAVAGAVVITEIMNNPSCVSDGDGEWLEIRNTSDLSLELRGWRLADLGTDSAILSDLPLAAGSRAVFCRNADFNQNGGIYCDAEAAMVLGNSVDEIVLYDAAGALIDQVVYDDGATFPDPNGAAMSLDPSADATSNDEGVNWCEAVTTISGPCQENDLGTPGEANPTCGGTCVDADLDGFEAESCGGTDCNDGDNSIYPGADEICGDTIDQDCNGVDLQCGCADSDQDGYEDSSCGGSDCDDGNAEINPGQDEICDDSIDNDCDNDTDGADSDCAVCADDDQDSFEDAACGGEDCDDSNAAVNPDADEICDDSIDNDCDGDTDTDDDQCAACQDSDNDSFLDDACGGSDCDDSNAAINPDAAEICDDNIDNDCDGDT